MQAILSTTYFGPVQWYQKLCRCSTVYMERCDSYRKQTYRNRCVIAAANGPQVLTVPVERPSGGGKLLTRDVRISDHGNWRHLHWHALMSAYSESPFFDYYADDLRPFFERRWEFLFDFNEAIRATLCSLLDIHPDVRPTNRYLGNEELRPFGNEGLRMKNEENVPPGQGDRYSLIHAPSTFHPRVHPRPGGFATRQLPVAGLQPAPCLFHSLPRVTDPATGAGGLQTRQNVGEDVGEDECEGVCEGVCEDVGENVGERILIPNSCKDEGNVLQGQGGGVTPPFATPHSSPVSDFRDAIDPKHPQPDADFEPRPYYQVFASRHGFLPNLSVLDLLFNMGPEGIFWLI